MVRLRDRRRSGGIERTGSPPGPSCDETAEQPRWSPARAFGPPVLLTLTKRRAGAHRVWLERARLVIIAHWWTSPQSAWA